MKTKLILIVLGSIILLGFGASVLKVQKGGAGGERIAGGYVAGHINIGPFCPVESADHPCNVPPEAYTSREVVIYYSDGLKERDRVNLDKKGNYKIALGPGKYFAQIQPAGIGPGEKKPFTVVSFQTTTLDFDIDTGIR